MMIKPYRRSLAAASALAPLLGAVALGGSALGVATGTSPGQEWTGIVSFASLAGAAAASAFVARTVLQRLRTLCAALHDVAQEQPARDPTMLGQIDHSIALLQAKQAHLAAEAMVQAEERAKSDLLHSAIDRHTIDFTESLAGVMRVLSDATQRMDSALVGMAGSASRAGDLAVSTTEAAKQSAADLAHVAMATEGLTGSISEITDAVAQASATAQGMSRHASLTENRMSRLAEAAGKVGSVARMIGAIAAQTNLLALNATIEAARAGEAGKGFAVVASEVKQLARRTADATGDIAAQIAAIQAATEEAVGAVREMADEVRQMEEMAGAIASAVRRQGDGVRDIADNIATISKATDGAATAMAEAAEAAEEARGTSSEVWYAAGNVGQEAETLAREFEYFLGTMRDESTDKRVFQRIACGNAPVVLHLPEDETVNGALLDISRGGLALRVSDTDRIRDLASGTQVTVTMPDALGDVVMRVVRIDPEQVGLVACQNQEASEVMDRAVSYFGTLRAAA